MKIIFLLLFSQLIFSQDFIEKTATYGVKIVSDEQSSFENGIREQFPNFNKNVEELEFTLSFNKKKAVFETKNKLYTNSEATEMGKAFIQTGITLYQSKDSIFSKAYDFENKEYNLLSFKKINWEIVNETKIINQFLCYKAVGVEETTNSKGVFKTNITAWFCPEIPYSFGPSGYGGLPGLIVELHNKRAVFGLNKITAEDLNKKRLSFIKIKKNITEQDFRNIINDFLKKQNN
jgi:GLPGLI family protein